MASVIDPSILLYSLTLKKWSFFKEAQFFSLANTKKNLIQFTDGKENFCLINIQNSIIMLLDFSLFFVSGDFDLVTRFSNHCSSIAMLYLNSYQIIRILNMHLIYTFCLKIWFLFQWFACRFSIAYENVASLNSFWRMCSLILKAVIKFITTSRGFR